MKSVEKKKVGMTVGTVAVAITLAAYVARKRAEKTTYGAQGISKITPRKMGLYEKYIKRGIDIVCATGALIVFSPVYLIVALLVKCKLGYSGSFHTGTTRTYRRWQRNSFQNVQISNHDR